MSKLYVPKGYYPLLDPTETQRAIKRIKEAGHIQICKGRSEKAGEDAAVVYQLLYGRQPQCGGQIVLQKGFCQRIVICGDLFCDLQRVCLHIDDIGVQAMLQFFHEGGTGTGRDIHLVDKDEHRYLIFLKQIEKQPGIVLDTVGTADK